MGLDEKLGVIFGVYELIGLFIVFPMFYVIKSFAKGMGKYIWEYVEGTNVWFVFALIPIALPLAPIIGVIYILCQMPFYLGKSIKWCVNRRKINEIKYKDAFLGKNLITEEGTIDIRPLNAVANKEHPYRSSCCPTCGK